MSKIGNRSQKFALLAVAAIALAACSGSSENSSSASTAAGRTKNVAFTTTTTIPALYKVGNSGPGGGTIVSVNMKAPAGSRYLEAACEGFEDGVCGGWDPSGTWEEVKRIVAAYRGGGKTDWHLPTKDELNELCKYARNTGQPAGAAVICGTNGGLRSGFANTGYWSSEAVPGQAVYAATNLWVYIQRFDSGAASSSKTGPYYARVVRKF
jgi:Protein of unknown function (DUF1566)